MRQEGATGGVARSLFMEWDSFSLEVFSCMRKLQRVAVMLCRAPQA